MSLLTVDEAERGVLAGERGVVARAITLVESSLEADRARAQELLVRLLPHTGKALRVGISGPPGAGKSTLIERLGLCAIEHGRRVAVLAVDPTSRATGGSILGDKTRMPRLALEARAFVRPTPAGDELGGVARHTHHAMMVLEAAGFDLVIVETVGVGQSEIEVSTMVDSFVLVAQPGAGDELQGIKRGIMEVADIVAVNKADGDQLSRARTTAKDVSAALRLLSPQSASWRPRTLLVSALEGTGVRELYEALLEHRAALEEGELEQRRSEQAVAFMWKELLAGVTREIKSSAELAPLLGQLEREVGAGALSPSLAAERALAAFRGLGRGAGRD